MRLVPLGSAPGGKWVLLLGCFFLVLAIYLIFYICFFLCVRSMDVSGMIM